MEQDVKADQERPLKPLWLNQIRFQMRWESDNGPIILDYPKVLHPTEIDELEIAVGIVVAGLRRRAKEIEALTQPKEQP